MSQLTEKLSQFSLLRKAALLLLSLALAVSTVCIPLSSSIPQAEADTLVVAIDPGHCGSDPGAVGIDGLKEANANWAIAQACVKELQTYAGVKVVLTQDNTVCLSRKERTDAALAQGADLIVSMHCNSASASASGSEVYVPNESAYMYNQTHVPGEKLGNLVLRNLVNLGFYNRGVKTWSYDSSVYPSPGGVIDYLGMNYYPRLHGVCGILIEHGFVTNSGDAAKLSSASWCEKIGKADAQAIAEFYGLKKASEVAANANLQKTGEAVTTKATVSEGYDGNPPIMGDAKVDVARMVEWYQSKGKTFPASTYTKYGASSIEEFCTILYEEATYEGVRPEVVFAQAMKETGWLAFGGQVKAEQCNFCGLGATDGGAAGADFHSYGKEAVRMGLRAQVQHLKAYASTASLKNDCVDPRFSKVTRGIAPTVMDLTDRWATADDYGTTLSKMVNELAKLEVTKEITANAKISLADVPAELISGQAATVYVDGVATTMKVENGYGTIPLEGGSSHSVVLYEYNKTGGSSDRHTVYPTGMHTWLITYENGNYVAKRYYGLDDLLRYAGSSIRVSGNKGIRMITGIDERTKDALTGSGVAGYTIVETGTLLAFSNRVENDSLTFNTEGVSRGKAYVKGQKDPVFATSNGVEQYTNVLVGFSTVEQYKSDMAMRSYAILADASGNQVVVYGGTLYRSIEYIAQQNADAFSKGTAAYNYVHGIIDACKE